MSPDRPYTRWVLEQISDSSAGSGEMAAHKVQILVTALTALRGRGGAQILGLSSDRIEDEGRADVEAAVVAALLGWKAHFAAEGDSVSLLFLDEVGAAHGVADLRLQQRFPLRCLMAAAVVDRDDDGVERARYADFAAFVDALLGR